MFKFQLAKLITDFKFMNTDNLVMEKKLDGRRACWYKGKLYGRDRRGEKLGNDLTNMYPQIKLPDDCIIDGEIIFKDENGKDNYEAGKFKKNYEKCVFVAFDILMYEGVSIKNKPFIERKAILRKINLLEVLQQFPFSIDKVKEFEMSGCEGVILKQMNSPYLSGRNWFKYKFWKNEVVDIIEHIPGDDLGCLMTTKGKVNIASKEHYNHYFKNKPKKVEVRYLELTSNGKFRTANIVSFGDNNAI